MTRSTRRARGCWAILLALLVGALFACSGSPAAQQKAASSTSGAASTNITIGIDVPFHPIWDYLEAKSSTYFAGKPYTVHFKVLDASTQVPAFGKGDLQVMTTVPSFMPIVKGQYNIDTTYLFPLARWTTGPQILVKKGSAIRTLQDLKGKKVAIPPLSSRFGAEQAAILAATGQTIGSYFKLQQTEAAAQQLTLGRVDAAFIEAPTTYPLLQTGKFEPIFSVHDAFLKAFHDPAVMNGGYIASTSFVKNNPQFVRDLIKATQDVWDLYQRKPAVVNGVASKVSGIPVAQLQVVGQVLDLAKIPASERQVTRPDIATWQKLYPLLQMAGFIKTAPADVPRMFALTSKLLAGK
ncbi:MAG: ABC transporter substrate-binding protein [Mycobacteriales bacterium]